MCNQTASSNTTTQWFRSNTTTRSILLGLDVFNTAFQTLCCYLLILIFRRTRRKRRQQIYVINLAASEVFANAFLTARDIINLMRLFDGDEKNGLDVAFWSMNMFFVTAVSYTYILAMMYLTGDRLLQIWLNMTYKIYWTINKTLTLLIATWTCSISIGIAFTLLTYFKYDYVKYEARIHRVMAVYVLTSWYIVFLIFAIVTYIYIFCHYVGSARNLSVNPRKDGKRVRSEMICLSTFNSVPKDPKEQGYKITWLVQSFIRSKFVIPLALVSSYLMLTVVPSLTRLSDISMGHRVPYELTFAYLISIRISYTVDGVIYVFLQKRVRALFSSRLQSFRNVYKSNYLPKRNQTGQSRAKRSEMDC